MVVIRLGSPAARSRTTQSPRSWITLRAWSWAARAMAQPEATCSSSAVAAPGRAVSTTRRCPISPAPLPKPR